jgi:hypothetical protein
MLDALGYLVKGGAECLHCPRRNRVGHRPMEMTNRLRELCFPGPITNTDDQLRDRGQTLITAGLG